MLKQRQNGLFVKFDSARLFERKKGFFIQTPVKPKSLPANVRQWHNGLWIAASKVSVWKQTPNKLVAFFQ